MLSSNTPLYLKALEDANEVLQQRLEQATSTCLALSTNDPMQKALLQQTLQQAQVAQTTIQRQIKGLNKSVYSFAQKLGASNAISFDHLADEATLKPSQTLFQRLFEDSQDAILLLEDGLFTDCNQAAITMMRCTSKEEFLSLRPAQLSPEFQPDGRSSVEKANEMMTLALDQGSHQFDWMHHRLDGEDFWVEVHLISMEVEGRHLLCATWRDIGARKAAEMELYKQQQLTRSTYEGMAHNIVIVDVSPDGDFRYVGWNPSTEEQTGISKEVALDKTPEQLLGQEQGSVIRQNYQRCLEVGTSITYEECVSLQGRPRYWLTTLNPLKNTEGRIYRIVLTTFEITDQKAVENTLQKTNVLLNSVVETIPGFLFVKDREGRHIVVNSNSAAFFGKPINEVIGKTDADLLPVEVAMPIMLKDQETMTQGITQRFEAVLSVEGIDHTYLTVKTPLRDAEGTIVGVVGLAQDISDRKAMEVSLRQSEQRFRDVTEAAGEYIWELSAEGRYTFVTERVTAVKGYSPAELLGHSPVEFMPQADIARAESILQAAEIDKSAFYLEHRDVLPSGNVVWEAVSGVPILDDQDEIIGFRGTGLSISERKAAETAIAESEAKFRQLVEDADDFIYTVAPDGSFQYMSPQFTRMCGYEIDEFLHESFVPLVHPDDLTHVMASTQRLLTMGKKQTGLELRLKHRDGMWVWVTCNNSPIKDATGQVIGLQGIAHDVSDRKAAEAALTQKAEELEHTLQELQRAQIRMIQNEKMSSLGQLVAGVAHEINNPVSFIYSNIPSAKEYAQDLLRLITLYQTHYPDPLPKIRAEIQRIDLEFVKQDLPKLLVSMKIGADRIRQIIGSLRTFSRLDEADCKEVDIHSGLDSSLVILEHRIKATSERPAIQIIKDYGELGLVECYAGQLNQVFMNILTNALDALEERDRHRSPQDIQQSSGTITIRTHSVGSDHIAIHILDNGSGMPKAIQQRVFDPFFTTKPVGQGTGMGMSISHQIITENHGGTIQCFSFPGQETEFIIEIPRSQGTS